MRRSVRAFTVMLTASACLLLPHSLFAHPMGNFSISHFTRLVAQSDAGQTRIVGRYVLDMAEIPTVSEMERLDANHDGIVSDAERTVYLQAQCAELGRNLTLNVNGQAVALRTVADAISLRSGAGGLQTLRLTLNLIASLPDAGADTPRVVEYADNNFPTRTGWKEIVVSPSALVRDASAGSSDISQELTVYPTDPGLPPPQTTQARFTLVKARQGAQTDKPIPSSMIAPPILSNQNAATPQDKFTQSIATANLTPALMLLALGSAFAFGALHALSPGHGKAMVAAYLVGTRGTAWHAVLLGLVVTLTHTLGVFALGLITLFASQRIVPEKLFPIISAISGALVALMGVGLLVGRWQAWRNAEGGQEEKRLRGLEGKVAASIGNDDEPDEFYNQRRAGGEVSLRALIGLGITGGALPCPSALVVMLSAIALHRIAFGLLLIVCFSLGLAVVLTLLGLLMMRARNLLERLPARGRLMAGVSVLSAGVVTIVGVALFVRALSGKF